MLKISFDRIHFPAIYLEISWLSLSTSELCLCVEGLHAEAFSSSGYLFCCRLQVLFLMVFCYVFDQICGVATVVNSIPTHIAIPNIFIHSCEIDPNGTPLLFSHHILVWGVSAHSTTMAVERPRHELMCSQQRNIAQTFLLIDEIEMSTCTFVLKPF